MALKIHGRMKVKTLRAEFKEEFGLTLRVYDGRSFADDGATLASLREKYIKSDDFAPKRNMQIGNFEKNMIELFGIKVQVASSDDSYLCDNDLTLAGAMDNENSKILEAEEVTANFSSEELTVYYEVVKREEIDTEDKLAIKLKEFYIERASSESISYVLYDSIKEFELNESPYSDVEYIKDELGRFFPEIGKDEIILFSEYCYEEATWEVELTTSNVPVVLATKNYQNINRDIIIKYLQNNENLNTNGLDASYKYGFEIGLYFLNSEGDYSSTSSDMEDNLNDFDEPEDYVELAEILFEGYSDQCDL